MRPVANLASLLLSATFIFVPAAGLAQPATDSTETATHTLVYKDGDRVQGRLVANDGTTISFQSARFGLLHVPASQAEVISTPAAATTTTPAAQEKSLQRFGHQMRDFFGPWHGRFSFSTEFVQDSDERRSNTVDARIERKWTQDELKMEGSYAFSKTNADTSTDLLQLDAYWRHDFTRRWFSLYHPSFEWNRNYIYNGVPADYSLLMNEVGGGAYLVRRDSGFLRCGLSENFHNVWTIASIDYIDGNTESAFVEAELQFPWEIKLNGRLVRYFSFSGGETGWERMVELTKKLTSTLVLGIHYESRHNIPDLRVQNYSNWRTLLGFDF
jgi:hypothetical protein